MNDFQVPENERAFLNNIRNSVAPGYDEPRRRAAFPDLFAAADDRFLVQNRESRNAVDYQGLVATFQENAKPLNLHVESVASFEAAAQCIADIITVREPEFQTTRHVMQHTHPDIASLRLWQLLEDTAVSLHTSYPEDSQVKEKTTQSFVGITAADWGIADSATLIQITRPGRPRSTSLVPSIHIGLLRISRLLSSLSEAYAMLRRQKDLPSFTFISGPSKTADIEAHMVHGAHGPREMHVILFDDIMR